MTTSLTWNQSARDEALSTAVTAVKLYARPGIDTPQWLSELSPYVTQQFAADYQGVNTEFIASSSVVEETATVFANESNLFGCRATVDTNAGKLTVQLLRNDADPKWKVESIVPELGKGAGK